MRRSSLAFLLILVVSCQEPAPTGRHSAPPDTVTVACRDSSAVDPSVPCKPGH
jgi:hypothetical protein